MFSNICLHELHCCFHVLLSSCLFSCCDDKLNNLQSFDEWSFTREHMIKFTMTRRSGGYSYRYEWICMKSSEFIYAIAWGLDDNISVMIRNCKSHMNSAREIYPTPSAVLWWVIIWCQQLWLRNFNGRRVVFMWPSDLNSNHVTLKQKIPDKNS